MTRAPFYPCQTTDGSTYVMDSRHSPALVVATISSSFDTVERWHIAKRRARLMNEAHSRSVYGTRQRIALGCLMLLAILVGLELATGDLSRLVVRAISAAL